MKHRELNRIKIWENIWDIISINFSPKIRFATAIAVLIIGIGIGRFIFHPAQNNHFNISDLDLSQIAEVESIQYNPKTKQVSVQFSTMNENKINGNMDSPAIQRLLAHSLLEEERPDMRLKTVSTLSMIKSFNLPVLEALIDVLLNDNNPGVRLKAIKIINTIPINHQIKELILNTLIRVLMTDENPAIKNEAANGLSRISDENVVPIILNAALKDSNEYLKYKASQISKKIKLERIEEDTKN